MRTTIRIRLVPGILGIIVLAVVGHGVIDPGGIAWMPAAPVARAQAVPPPPAPAAPAPVPAPAPAPAPAAAPAPAPAAAPAPGAAPAGPIATAEGEDPGVRVDVTQLKRDSGGTVTLKFTLVNDSDKDLGMTYYMTESDNSSVSGVHLVDAVGKKKYFVLRDAENVCICSKSIGTVEAKTSANYWAKFPAPPETVEKISVEIYHFGPLDDVPISR